MKPSREQARKLEIEMLEREIIDLKGIVRENALKAYRRLLLPVLTEPVYLIRSE